MLKFKLKLFDMGQLIFWLVILGIATYLGLQGPTDPKLSWWQWWELLSILVTLLYSVGYYLYQYFLEADEGIQKRLVLRMFLGALALASFACLVRVFWLLYYGDRPQEHLQERALYVAIVVTIFALYDLSVALGSQRAELKREYSASLWFLEVPLMVALWVIYLVVSREETGLQVFIHAHEVFIGGAVAFQSTTTRRAGGLRMPP